MSLILDALKKVERERDNPDHVVVVGSIPWQGVQRPRRMPLLLAGLALAAVVIGSVGWWAWTIRTRAPVTAARATRPAATVATTPAPAPIVTAPASAAATAVPSSPPSAESSRPPAVAPPSTTTASRADASIRVPAAHEAASAVGVAPARARRARPTQVPPVPAPSDAPVAAAGPRADSVGGDLRLQAISIQAGQPVAVINDRLVREGDSFGGIRIVRIGEAEVEVDAHGRRLVLRF